MKEPVLLAGLGLMGSAIAANLVDAGHVVHGVDPVPKAAEEARRKGVQVLGSLAELPPGPRVAITSLPSVAALDDVVQALEYRSANIGVVVELSTLPLADKERARRRLGERGVAMLDAPISGTGAQAVLRDLSVYGSGDIAAWRQVEPIVSAFAMRARHVGAFGNGMRVKCIANLLVAIHNVATAEALALAEDAGMDLASVVELIREGAGNSRIFDLRAPLMASGRYLPATMKLDVWQKDMAIIDAFARGHGARTPLFDACQPIYAAAQESRPQADTAAVFETLRRGAPSASVS